MKTLQLLIFILLLMFCSCNVKHIYEKKTILNLKSKDLNHFNVKQEENLLFLWDMNLNNENVVIIQSSDTVYNKILTYRLNNPILGHAIIDNSISTEIIIKHRNDKIKLSQKGLRNYKYVYITDIPKEDLYKNPDSKLFNYKIIYTNKSKVLE